MRSFLLVLSLSTVLFGADAKPAFAKLGDKAESAIKDVANGELNDLIGNITKALHADDIVNQVNKYSGKLDGFGFETDLLGLIFEVECNLPDINKIDIPKIPDICTKIDGKFSAKDLLGFDIGVCSGSISNPGKIVADKIDQWCADSQKTVKIKEKGSNKEIVVKKERTPVDIVTASRDNQIDVIRAASGIDAPDSRDVKMPSGKTRGEIAKEIDVENLLDSNISAVQDIVYKDDSFWKDILAEYLNDVPGASIDNFLPTKSSPLPKDDIEYNKIIKNAGELTLHKTDNAMMLQSFVATLKSNYLVDTKLSDGKKIKKLKDLNTTADALEREKKIFDALMGGLNKNGGGELNAKSVSAVNEDNLKLNNFVNILKKLDTNRVSTPTQEYLDRLTTEQRMNFYKKARIQEAKDALFSAMVAKIAFLQKRQRDLSVESSATCASSFYPEVAFKEIQNMLKSIH